MLFSMGNYILFVILNSLFYISIILHIPLYYIPYIIFYSIYYIPYSISLLYYTFLYIIFLILYSLYHIPIIFLYTTLYGYYIISSSSLSASIICGIDLVGDRFPMLCNWCKTLLCRIKLERDERFLEHTSHS